MPLLCAHGRSAMSSAGSLRSIMMSTTSSRKRSVRHLSPCISLREVLVERYVFFFGAQRAWA